MDRIVEFEQHKNVRKLLILKFCIQGKLSRQTKKEEKTANDVGRQEGELKLRSLATPHTRKTSLVTGESILRCMH